MSEASNFKDTIIAGGKNAYNSTNVSFSVYSLLAIASFGFACAALYHGVWNDQMFNSRTVHFQEYVDGSVMTDPQNFLGFNWPVKAERLNAGNFKIYPVSERTCFIKDDSHEEGPLETSYKRKVSICGPNMWHMQKVCKGNSNVENSLTEYFEMTRHGGIFPSMMESLDIPSNSTKNAKLEQDKCVMKNINPLFSFETDSNSYSVFSNGNIYVYVYTAASLMSILFIIIVRGHASDQNLFIFKVFNWVFFVFTYAGYFVFWNATIRQKDSVISISSTDKGQEVWAYDDHCYGSVFSTWILYSLFCWCVWNLPKEDKTQQSGTGAEMQALQNPAPYNVEGGEFKNDLQIGTTWTFNLTPHKDGYTEEMKDYFKDSNIETLAWNHYVWSYRNALIFLFAFPVLVACCIYTQKYNIDFNVQTKIVIAFAISFLDYTRSSLTSTIIAQFRGKDDVKDINYIMILINFIALALEVILYVTFFQLDNYFSTLSKASWTIDAIFWTHSVFIFFEILVYTFDASNSNYNVLDSSMFMLLRLMDFSKGMLIFVFAFVAFGIYLQDFDAHDITCNMSGDCKVSMFTTLKNLNVLDNVSNGEIYLKMLINYWVMGYSYDLKHHSITSTVFLDPRLG